MWEYYYVLQNIYTRLGGNFVTREIGGSGAGDFERIFRLINDYIRRGSRKVLADADLTRPQFHTLLHLAFHDNDMSIGHLCQHMNLSSATMTGIIDRLEARELVQRVRDTKDRRVIRIQITEQGHKVLECTYQGRINLFENALSVLDEGEKEKLYVLLEKFYGGLSEYIENLQNKEEEKN